MYAGIYRDAYALEKGSMRCVANVEINYFSNHSNIKCCKLFFAFMKKIKNSSKAYCKAPVTCDIGCCSKRVK